jgi:hypothetical protein
MQSNNKKHKDANFEQKKLNNAQMATLQTATISAISKAGNEHEKEAYRLIYNKVVGMNQGDTAKRLDQVEMQMLLHNVLKPYQSIGTKKGRLFDEYFPLLTCLNGV